MKNPYLKTENKISDHLINAVKYFRQLESMHPSHEKDFIDGIHKCQNVIIHRIVQREHPKEFPTFKIITKGGNK